MKSPQEFEVKLIDFEYYREELLQLRKLCWQQEKSKIKFKDFFTQKDILLDFSSIHCGIFHNEKLIASHRLQILDSIEDLPFSKQFKPTKVKGSNWYTFSNDKFDYTLMKVPIATTGRLVIHPSYRKKGISESILSFWIDFSKKNNINTLISFPSPWMVSKLLKAGFEFKKNLGNVFEPVPSIEITLVIMKF